jgi:fluoroacetyl-CoA thioesterase
VESDLKPGITGEVNYKVEYKDTAANYGNSGVEVLATPVMLGLMERAAITAIQPYLNEGSSSVGSNLNVSHLAATPVSMKVKFLAELQKVEGKKLTFKVEAFDEFDKIGEGTHERFIINLEKFLKKAAEKKEKGSRK